MKRLPAIALGAWVIIVLVLAGAAQAGLRYNGSPSVPTGFYRASAAPAAVGDYVLVCLPLSATVEQAQKRGYLSVGSCPGRVSELIKVLAAQHGDRISINASGVAINGQLWPDSAQKPADAQARPLPALRLERNLELDEVLLLSDRCSSGFDSRYFGPIDHRGLRGTARPVLLWRDLPLL